MADCCSPLYLRRGPAGASFVEAFTAAPASAVETPFASRGEAAVSEGGLNAVSAELLSSAQQKLQDACTGVPPAEMLNGAGFAEHQAEGALPKMNSMDAATTDICALTRDIRQQEGNHRATINPSDQHGEGMGESDEESISSHSSQESRKRKYSESSCHSCDQWAKEAMMHQHQYRTMCSGLAAQNALLKSQLFAVVKALRRERAASQVELQSLRQKNAALGAFLPQSVAAFADEVPASLYTKKGMQALAPYVPPGQVAPA